MPSFVEATISSIISERSGLQRVNVRLPGCNDERAYVLTDLIGSVAIGDRVVVNTTAVELGLGTGGWHFVHWNLSRSEWISSGPGHVMKLRYTSLQSDTGVAEEFAESAQQQRTVAGVPVIVCLLHSQIAAVAVAAKHERPDLRVAYVMTDQAALPLALSDLVADLRARGLLDVTITCGQSFGGDIECVNVFSAIEYARGSLDADLIIVGDGPGVVGTGTRLGFSGLVSVNSLSAAHSLRAHPILALRWSDADRRERHRGVSHHGKTLLEMCPFDVEVAIPSTHSDLVDLQDAVPVEVPDVLALFDSHGLRVGSMGRSASEDVGLFTFAAAAGILALRHIRE